MLGILQAHIKRQDVSSRTVESHRICRQKYNSINQHNPRVPNRNFEMSSEMNQL